MYIHNHSSAHHLHNTGPESEEVLETIQYGLVNYCSKCEYKNVRSKQNTWNCLAVASVCGAYDVNGHIFKLYRSFNYSTLYLPVCRSTLVQLFSFWSQHHCFMMVLNMYGLFIPVGKDSSSIGFWVPCSKLSPLGSKTGHHSEWLHPHWWPPWLLSARSLMSAEGRDILTIIPWLIIRSITDTCLFSYQITCHLHFFK